jgi:hypothetical protein
MVGVAGNNVEHFSALWTKMGKNHGHQHERIATTQNSLTFL